jgi:hypothetical protein
MIECIIGYFQMVFTFQIIMAMLLCITSNGAIELGTMVKWIIEVFFRLLHYIVTLYLPVVFGAVATLERLVLSLLNSGKYIDIFVVNINVQ